MRKIVTYLTLVSMALLVLLALPSFVLGQEEEVATDEAQLQSATESAQVEYDFASMTTYEMFWPLVAGKVPGDGLYQFKVWRDKLMGLFYFNKSKKSEYLKQLANKRLIEIERLVELERHSHLESTLQKSSDNLERGVDLLLASGTDAQTEWLTQEFRKDLDKHRIVLERLGDKVQEDQKGSFDKSLQTVKDLIEKLN